MVAIPLIQIALRVLLSLVVALGLQQIWAAVVAAIGHFINKKASWFKTVLQLTVIGQLVQAAARPVVHQGQNDIGVEAKTREPAGSAFAGGLAAMFAYHAFTLKYLAAGTLEGFDTVRRHAIPAGARAATRPAREQSERASRQARSARKGAAAATAGSVAARREAERARNQAETAQAEALRASRAATIPHPATLPRVRARDFEDRVTSWANKHLRKLALGLGSLVGVGIVVRALVRHLPWFQCRNVDKVARSLCRMPTDLLDELLLGLTAIIGTISIVEFAKVTQEVSAVATDALTHFVREFHGLEGHDDANREAYLAIHGD